MAVFDTAAALQRGLSAFGFLVFVWETDEGGGGRFGVDDDDDEVEEEEEEEEDDDEDEEEEENMFLELLLFRTAVRPNSAATASIPSAPADERRWKLLARESGCRGGSG